MLDPRHEIRETLRDLLEFDRCVNRSLIAEACIAELGGTLFKGHVNLNTAKLKDLSGKVIVLFSPKGATEVALERRLGAVQGILQFNNLYDMPNIVMIDFADEPKCPEIRVLNDLSPAELAALGRDAQAGPGSRCVQALTSSAL